LKSEGQKVTAEYSGEPVFQTDPKTGVVSRMTPTTNFDSKDEKGLSNWIVGKIMSNRQAVQGLMEDFDKNATSEEKLKYLDVDKDGKVSEGENAITQATTLKYGNPILQWAVDNPKYRQAPIIPKTTTWTTVSQPGNGKAFNWNLNIGAEHNRNNEFPLRGQVDIDTDDGKVTLPNSLDFSGIPRTTTDARKINSVLIPDGNGGYTEKSLGESASFDIVTYSPEKDILIIKLKSNTSDRTYREGVNLAVKGEEFDDLLKRKPFGIHRQKLTAQGGSLDNL
jgi:hypothetical protein